LNKKPILAAALSLCFSMCFAPAVFSSVTHKVKQGDNLYTIAKKYQVSVEQLKSTNALKGNSLRLGQQIVVQKSATPSTRMNRTVKVTKRGTKYVRVQILARGKGPTEAPVDSGEAENDGDFTEYKTKRGDTLERLAARFGIEKEDILELNSNLGKKLPPGKLLYIPRVETENEDVYVNLPSKPTKSWKNKEERYMLVKVAKSFMGAPYRYGGESVRGLDCSAYVKKIYDIFDVQLPRSAREQFHVGSKISRDQLIVGDLVFFRTKRYAKYPTHVGIYIGDGNFIHSSSGNNRMGVKIDSLASDFYNKTFTGATRVKKAPDDSAEAARNPEFFPNNS
jgi:peptidoglycan endopeptidase LytE